MNENLDARVVKTRRLIEGTFLELLQEIPFEKLTTTRLIKECLISKGTFYAHYIDKYDLAEQLLDKELDTFEKLLFQRLNVTSSTSEEIAVIISKAFDVSKELVIFEKISLPNRQSFYLELQTVYQRVYRQFLSQHGYEGDLELQAFLLSSIAMSYVTYIVQGHKAKSIGELQTELEAFMSNMKHYVIQK